MKKIIRNIGGKVTICNVMGNRIFNEIELKDGEEAVLHSSAANEPSSIKMEIRKASTRDATKIPNLLIALPADVCETIINGTRKALVFDSMPYVEPPYNIFVYRHPGKVKHLINNEWKYIDVEGGIIGQFRCNKVHQCNFDWENFSRSGIEQYDISEKMLENIKMTMPQLLDMNKNHKGNKVLHMPVFIWDIGMKYIFNNLVPLDAFMFAAKKCECEKEKPSLSQCSECGKRTLFIPPEKWFFVDAKPQVIQNKGEIA